MKKPTGLGRGLSALLDDAQQGRNLEGEAQTGAVREIEVAAIQPNPHQPRKRFDEAAIAELATSIQDKGVLQPILVRPSGSGFQIVAGERRWRAAQRAQLHRIPAIVRSFDDESTAEVALIENVQREQLSAIEEAQAYQQLIERYGHTQDVVARMVGKSRSHVANLIRLLGLPHAVQEMLLRSDISMGHARALLAANDPEALAKDTVRLGYSVRQVEQLAKTPKSDKASKNPSAAPRAVNADIAALERQLGDLLGLRVKVTHQGKGGTVALHYGNLDQLDLICQRLSGEAI